MKRNNQVIFRPSLLLVCASFLLPNTVTAQRVSTCEELGLRPIEPGTGNDLLRLLLETDKFPERGCLVHHHPNGKDYVITPADWGESPVDRHRILIDDAMNAITVSRDKYVQYGTLNSALFYIFDNVSRGHVAGTTFWLIGNACWMVSGVPSLYETSNNNRQVFAHEIGHCFVMENVPGLEPYYNDNNWFDESVSEFLSSVAYPGNNLEFRFAQAYDLDGAELQQPYRAYPLWYYFAKERGREAVVPLMQMLASFETRDQRLNYLRGTGFDQLYQHFLFEFYQNTIPDSGGGHTIPSETEIVKNMENIALVPGIATSINLNDIPSERLSVFEFIIPQNYNLIINPPVNSSEKTFFSLIAKNKSVKEWVEPEKIQGKCGYDSRIQILASHLSGDMVTGTTLNYELKEKNYCCEAGLVVNENPSEEELDGKFNFDYYIESYVNYKSEEDSQTIPMNYYVNSKDGSMLLTDSWFTDNFGTSSSGGMEAHAVVWLPNGQVVGYVSDSGQKRAITIALNQTKADVMGVRAIKIDEFLREAPGSGISPAPLPAGSSWTGNASGAAYYQPEMSDPSELNLLTAYISDTTTGISSPLPSFGFMVGYVRDSDGRNKKLVYTRVDRPNGDMFETHLESIAKSCASFDGSGYKKMIIGSSTGAIANMSESERDGFADRQKDMQEQMLLLLADMERCRGNKRCEAEVTRRMMDLQKEMQDAVYDLPGNDEYSGTAATDLQDRQSAIQDQMYALQDEMLEKEIHCDRLERQNTSCGGCMNMIVETCKEQYEDLKEKMQYLECRMARLHGAGDMMEDCE